MVRRALTSVFFASAFAFVLGSVSASAAIGVMCKLGGQTFPILIGDANPDTSDWRAFIESPQHATDICMNYYGGKTGGRVK